MLFTSMQSSASLQINFVPLLLFLLGTFVEYNNIEAREALEHRLLKPLGSKLRSEMTSKATGSLQGHFSYSINHCHMLVLQGHCALVYLQTLYFSQGLDHEEDPGLESVKDRE